MSNWKKGTQLNDGQYVIESILLRDGYGLFYRAKDTLNDRLVTINTTKIAEYQTTNLQQLQDRLIQQAQQIADNCQNSYIIQLKPEVFWDEDHIYMVMDYPDGEDLATYLDNNGQIPAEEVLNIITKIASALNLLHQSKVLHQDIKPQNIIIDSQTQNPVLINYGMAIKLFTITSRKNANNINDCFLPPEKFNEKKKLGIGSDVYSIAATAYTLATGQLPTSAYLRVKQQLPLIPPQQLNPSLSDRFNQAIIKGMDLDLKQRPQYLKDWLDLFKEKQKLSQSQYETLDDLPTDISDIPPENLAIFNAIVNNDETIVQRVSSNVAPPTITNREKNYPNIEKYTFETIEIEEKKGFFSLFPKQKKKTNTSEGQFFVEYLGTGVNLEMIFIPAGTMMMGGNKNEKGKDKNENPQHLVNLKSFYISKYPITQKQWRIVSRFPKITRNLKQKPSFFRGDNLPVERISWLDTQEFSKRISKYSGRTYRLPTESEWEYACRGNTTTAFFFGETMTPEFANYDQSSNTRNNQQNLKTNTKKTTSVDNYYPNPFGIYDCHGNVWEWCEDNYVDNYLSHPIDGSAYYAPNDNPERVVRGGSWSLPAYYSRSSRRNGYITDSTYNFIGMRIVCVLD